jgi:hypothetical protein
MPGGVGEHQAVVGLGWTLYLVAPAASTRASAV